MLWRYRSFKGVFHAAWKDWLESESDSKAFEWWWRFCSVYYEVKEAVRELLDLKFKILPALEDVACGKKRRRKSGKDGES